MLGHLPPSPVPGQRPHPPLYWLLLWVAVWMAFGLVGHSPWRDDELVQLALAVDALDAGHLAAPMLGGAAWLETPPWAVWASSVGIATLHPALALHDAARLPGLFALLLTFWALLRWAHPRLARRERWATGLSLFSALSLAIPAHGNAAELWTLAAFALLTAGACRPDRRWRRTTTLLAAGLTLAFLASGLQAWLAGALTLAAVSALQPARSQHRAHLLGVGISVAVAVVWVAAVARSGHLSDWLAQDPLLRLLASPSLAMQGLWPEVRGLLWSWPIWPLALWTLWLQRRNWRTDPRILAPLALVVSGALVWWLAPGGREARVLPLLAPLALLAGPGLLRLPRGGAQALHWFGVLLFTALLLLLWVYWAGAHLGWPDFAATRTGKLLPIYDRQWALWQPVLGIAATLAAMAIVHALRRTPLQPLLAWCTGASVGWMLIIVLGGHWLETSRSWAPVMASLGPRLPRDDCIGTAGLGPAEVAAVRVYTGRQLRIGAAGSTCSWQLARRSAGERGAEPAPDAVEVWRGRVPTDRNDRLLLYRLP